MTVCRVQLYQLPRKSGFLHQIVVHLKTSGEGGELRTRNLGQWIENQLVEDVENSINHNGRHCSSNKQGKSSHDGWHRRARNSRRGNGREAGEAGEAREREEAEEKPHQRQKQSSHESQHGGMSKPEKPAFRALQACGVVITITFRKSRK